MTGLLSLSIAASLALLLTWIVYPLWCSIRTRPGQHPGSRGEDRKSRVAAIIATRDEPALVARRIDNLTHADPAADITSIVVGVDATSAWSLRDYARVSPPGVATFVAGAPPGGKATALNAAVAASPPSDLILIADTAQTFAPGAIRHLVDAIMAGGWSGASGVVKPTNAGFLGSIWQSLEQAIRHGQSRGRGLITTSGAITMLRQSAWHDLPAGTICDDLFLTMKSTMSGGKFGLCVESVAIDPRVTTPSGAFRKKVRTLTGLWQYILELEPDAIRPSRNPVWIDFLAHKIMRLATPPLFVIAMLPCGAWAVETFYNSGRGARVVLILALVVAVLTMSLSDSLRWRAATICAPMVATWNGLRRNWNVW